MCFYHFGSNIFHSDLLFAKLIPFKMTLSMKLVYFGLLESNGSYNRNSFETVKLIFKKILFGIYFLFF